LALRVKHEDRSARNQLDARAALERVAPKGSRARASLSVGATTAREAVTYASRTRWRWRRARTPGGAEPEYARWLERHGLTAQELKAQRDRIGEAGIGIAVDCLVLPGDHGTGLTRTVTSLKSQTLRSWTARVVGTPITASLLDSRITQVSGEETQLLGDLVDVGDDRDFVLVLEAGDVLEPDLLFHIVARGWDDPFADLVHWDDDLIDAVGTVRDPRFRPDWSPEMLLSANYLGRSFAVRRERVAAAGGFPTTSRDARYWDLLLRLGLDERRVARVPRVLQHVRRRPEPDPAEATTVVSAHLGRAGRDATVGYERGAVRVRWQLGAPPAVTVVIPTRSRKTLLTRCLHGLARTDYPSLEVVVVDGGEQDEASARWYRQWPTRLGVRAVPWEGPFNYSAANNRGARAAGGDVLVFLNDDIELTEPLWLHELVGWLTQPGIGLAGLQLLAGDGLIQHGGVVVGMNGFAGHLFAGMTPGTDTLLGSTAWYRNCLSVTAACVAIERSLFERIEGFDERFVLCGSDVVLGLDARFYGHRAVCSPYGGVRHLEGETRGQDVPPEDFFSSYWRYQRWLRGGDPYFSPNLSLQSTEPRLRDPSEPEPMAVVGGVLNRSFSVFRQTSDEQQTGFLVRACRADSALAERVRSANHGKPSPVRSINWFLPDIDSPFYGGINTALRIADVLAREHGVENQFVLLAEANERYVRSALTAPFPALGDSLIAFSNGRVGPNLDTMPAADVSIGTQWHTAYMAASFTNTARRFYLIQDFEPLFYPAGSNYALAEETYRLGLYGICNTEHMLELYRDRYGGEGTWFLPAVDRSVFYPDLLASQRPSEPVTIFTYARPGHWRNCWELASLALRTVKQRLGERVRIVTAGSWARPDDLGRGIEHLGLLDYRETGELYRACDLGLVLTVSEHPSYLPLELLACGTPVVAFDNPAGDWILHHEQNCLRCPRTVDGLVEGLERMATDGSLRERLARQGIADIAAKHGDWDAALAGIYGYLCAPDEARLRRLTPDSTSA
jgi:O-antigen biosynthesis protein